MGETNDDALRARNEGLAIAANGGDREAAAHYLKENLPYLSRMARWLAGGTLDPDDLAAECIASLLAAWKRGEGPTSHPNAYVVRAMRNRLIDERRSPRSRVQGLIESEQELPSEHLESRAADLHREFGYVRRALGTLPEDQQHVLAATVIDGRKPAELTDELGRSASAIYSLSHRAKARLRRATLREVLIDDAPPECRHAADRLPESIPAEVDDLGESVGTEHQRSCARCRSAWARFSGMATLGILGLLIVGNTVNGADPAQASEGALARTSRRIAPNGLRAPLMVAAAAGVLALTGIGIWTTEHGAAQPSARLEPEASATVLPGAKAGGDVGMFRIPSVALDAPLGEVSEVDGQITPPGLSSVYRVTNRGVSLSDAEQGTLYLVTHSTPGAGTAPGDALVDVDHRSSAVALDANIDVGDRRYEVDDSMVMSQNDVSKTAELWKNTPRRLVLITSLQNPVGTPSVDNVVILAHLVD